MAKQKSDIVDESILPSYASVSFDYVCYNLLFSISCLGIYELFAFVESICVSFCCGSVVGRLYHLSIWSFIIQILLIYLGGCSSLLISNLVSPLMASLLLEEGLIVPQKVQDLCVACLQDDHPTLLATSLVCCHWHLTS